MEGFRALKFSFNIFKYHLPSPLISIESPFSNDFAMFSEKISKSGSQPIIGTQINFKFEDTIGLLPLFALNENGYKKIIELSSMSYLKNDAMSEPHLIFEELLEKSVDEVEITIYDEYIASFTPDEIFDEYDNFEDEDDEEFKF